MSVRKRHFIDDAYNLSGKAGMVETRDSRLMPGTTAFFSAILAINRIDIYRVKKTSFQPIYGYLMCQDLGESTQLTA